MAKITIDELSDALKDHLNNLGITEKELSTTELFSNEVIEEITQRITLSRKDPALLDKIHVFKILGLVE